VRLSWRLASLSHVAVIRWIGFALTSCDYLLAWLRSSVLRLSRLMASLTDAVVIDFLGFALLSCRYPGFAASLFVLAVIDYIGFALILCCYLLRWLRSPRGTVIAIRGFASHSSCCHHWRLRSTLLRLSENRTSLVLPAVINGWGFAHLRSSHRSQ